MRALALMIGPTADGWAVYLTDGREVARYRGIGAKRRALRYVALQVGVRGASPTRLQSCWSNAS
jgi:hypothetical protein